MVKVIEVVELKERRGTGPTDTRVATLYFNKDGDLLAVNDSELEPNKVNNKAFVEAFKQTLDLVSSTINGGSLEDWNKLPKEFPEELRAQAVELGKRLVEQFKQPEPTDIPKE